MTRAERLSTLLEILHRASPATGPQLATVFGATVRTIYRDIEILRSQGHDIDATEIGFRLIPAATPTLTLPTPTAFTAEELEAILVGLSWLVSDEESQLVEAANSATAKVEAMLPPLPQPAAPTISNSDDPLEMIHAAIEAECRLHLEYRDAKGRPSTRIVWPIELYRYDDTGMIAAWCERRSDFRNFRVDRIQSLHMLDRYPARRQTLLARLQLQQDQDPFH